MLLIPKTFLRRLQVYITCATGLVLALTTWVSYQSNRNSLNEQANREALKEVRSAVVQLDDFLNRTAEITRSLAIRQSGFGHEPDASLLPYLRSVLKETPDEELYGIFFAYERKDWKETNSMPWVDRKSFPATVKVQYDYHDAKQGWYQTAKRSRRFHITDPYFDEDGSEISLLTISAPAHDAHGEFIGVAGTDISVRHLQKIIDRIRLRGSDKHEPGSLFGEYAYLVSGRGKIISHPNPALVLRRDSEGAHVRDLPDGRFVAAEGEGGARVEIDGSIRRVYWAVSGVTGWKVVLNIPEESIIGPVTALTRRLIGIGVLELLFMVLVVSSIARRVTQPLAQLTEAAGEIQNGKFQNDSLEKLARNPDELGRLASGFQTMAHEIKSREAKLEEWNQNLEKTVEARTAELGKAVHLIASEMSEAADYVRSLLPPPHEGSIRTAWRFIPSQQLGGDAFGYDWLDDENFAMYLLDVCGHGVGAALLSISVMNVLRSNSLPGVNMREPSAVLAALNERFPMENHNNMYFTMWYGVYNNKHRRLAYASGGHPPAVLVAQPGTTGVPARTLRTKGMVVGSLAGVPYETGSCEVPPGSRLFIFSDGAYEITKKDGGMLQFEEFLSHLTDATHSNHDLDHTIMFARNLSGRPNFEDDVSIIKVEFHDH
jgi:serine phosphatase RsbU (regulator of sigma subunit)